MSQVRSTLDSYVCLPRGRRSLEVKSSVDIIYFEIHLDNTKREQSDRRQHPHSRHSESYSLISVVWEDGDVDVSVQKKPMQVLF